MDLRRTIFVSLLFLAACPGSLEDPERFRDGGLCPDVPSAILLAKCGATAGCHTVDSPAAGLDLASPDPASRLLGINASEDCGGAVLVSPARPEDSLIYTKVTPDFPCGTRMPMAQDPLSDAEQACLLAWIRSLAEP